jgi:hypothetical protein
MVNNNRFDIIDKQYRLDKLNKRMIKLMGNIEKLKNVVDKNTSSKSIMSRNDIIFY